MDDIDPLESLASAVADGRPIEWESAGASVATEDVDAIGELRIIQEIARFHRGSVDPATGLSAAAELEEEAIAAETSRTPLFEWGTLRVHERLGGGAFGEVFRAWDTSLQRDVALKLLRRETASGMRAAASIIREGQLLARVMHPNVMVVHGAREIDGQVGIWGELLRGRTLADIVADDGPMSAPEASHFLDGVCRALTAVHRAGLLHRDVKAQNVMREQGGRVVLMDFGLGREANLPGRVDGLELAGTPLYLAPELFRGDAASAQSDIYSAGVLLFHLVTGRFPMAGRTIAEIARQHERGQRIRIQDLRSDLPSPFVRVVERALAAERTDRFESAGEFQAALAASAFVPSAAPVRRRVPWWGVAGAIGAIGALALAAAAIAVPALRQRTPTSLAFSLPPPPGDTFTNGSRNVPVISPDGRHVAFIVSSGGISELWIRDLAELSARRMNGTAGAFTPFWSPDSRSVWFVAAGTLQRVSLSGARSGSIPMPDEYAGGTWNQDNMLLIARTTQSGLVAKQDATGPDRQITRVDKSRGETAHSWPQFLPDGQHFIFFVSGSEAVKGAYLGSLDGSPSRRLVVTDSSAVYGSGNLLYTRDGALYAEELDTASGTLRGQPTRVRDQIATTWDARLLVSLSEDGRMLFAGREATDNRQLTWTDAAGRVLGIVGRPDRLANPALSTDGRYLAVQNQDDSQKSLIRLWDFELGAWNEDAIPIEGENAAWGPDHLLAFSAPRGGVLEVATIHPFRDQSPVVVVASDQDQQNKQVTDVSRDGKWIAYTSYRVAGNSGNYDLWIVRRESGERRAIHQSDSHEISGRFSPDGRMIAFASNHGGRMDVYVQAIDGKGEPLKRSGGAGGYDPVWLSESELLFVDSAGWMNLAEVPRDGRAAPKPPKRVFDTAVRSPGASRNHYDVSREMRRVIVAVPQVGAFSVITEWPTRLSR